MQATMNVQPLSFEERYHDARARAFSPFSPEPNEDLDEFSGSGQLARQKHPLLSFDEVLDEDYELDESPEEEEEEEEEEYIIPRRRRFLTEEEYQREAANFTKQQLKESGLYYKHAYHFWRLRSRDNYARFKPHLVKFLIALVVLVIPVVVGLFLVEDAPLGTTDVSMLPDLAQKVPTNDDGNSSRARDASLLSRLLRRAGLKQRRENATEIVLPPPPARGAAEERPAKPAPLPAVVENKQPVPEEKAANSRHVGVYEPGLSFSSIIPDMQGMNIFSFAYTAAIDFLSKTFGWNSNATVTVAEQ